MSSTSFRLQWFDALLETKRDTAHGNLDAATRAVAAVLFKHMHQDGTCWPGIRTIASQAGVTPPTARDRVQRLEQHGWLVVHRRNKRVNQYQAAIPNCAIALHSCTPVPVGQLCNLRPQTVQSEGPNCATALHVTKEPDGFLTSGAPSEAPPAEAGALSGTPDDATATPPPPPTAITRRLRLRELKRKSDTGWATPTEREELAALTAT